ncbi:MAG: AraC family transcriptional regulator [Acutalibacteraceae bacterium]|nr:AraC family transcriptional regulator [Acutalibacteraceae bacterium]
MNNRSMNNFFKNGYRDYNEVYFPVEVNENKIIENDFVMPHHQPYIELHYIIDGSCDYYIDGKKQSAKTGDIVYLKPETVHSMYKSCETLKYYSFNIMPNFLYTENSGCSTEKYFKPLKQGDYDVTFVISEKDEIYPQLKEYLFSVKDNLQSKENLFELETKITLLSYFLLLFKSGHVKKRSNRDKAKYKSENAICTAIDYINDNYFRSLTVDEIAENAGISSSHFMKLFREYTHTTCISYINKCRLTKAVELLETTRYNILDVATAVGYNNISLFNRDFKKIYGTTPKEIRKNAKIEEQLNKKKRITL